MYGKSAKKNMATLAFCFEDFQIISERLFPSHGSGFMVQGNALTISEIDQN